MSCGHTEQSDARQPLAKIASKPRDSVTTKRYGPGDVVTKGYLDRKGQLWFTTTDEGVFKYVDEQFTNYTIEDGLCGNDVWAITEDTAGVMWFGTANGLCSFDGHRFSNIPLPPPDTTTAWLQSSYPIVNPSGVSGLIQDKSGIFWIGSNGAGAYRYDGTQYQSYLAAKGNKMPDSLHHNVILSLIEDTQGNIWFGSFSHGGVSKYDGGKLTHYPLKDGYGDGMISSIYEDSRGNIWIGTRNTGIWKYDGSEFKNISVGSKSDQIAMATFLEDSEGTIWVASYARKGIYQYNGTAFEPFVFDKSEALVDIKCMVEDDKGNIWFGGRYGILWKYDGKDLVDYTQLKRIQ